MIKNIFIGDTNTQPINSSITTSNNTMPSVIKKNSSDTLASILRNRTVLNDKGKHGFEKIKISTIRKYLDNAGIDYGRFSQKHHLIKICQHHNISGDMIDGTGVFLDSLEGTMTEQAQNLMDELRKSFDKVEVEQESVPVQMVQQAQESSEKNTDVKYGDLGWDDYVMSQFDESELDNGYPKLKGLRRLVQKLLGDIVFSGPISERSTATTTRDEFGYACCNYEVVINWRKDFSDGFIDVQNYEYPKRVFRSMASSYIGNTPSEVYARFPEAIAETRAEARTLRKALNLSVVAHEELAEPQNKENDETRPLNANQKSLITKRCADLEIDLDLLKAMNNITSSLDELSYSEATKLIQKIKELQDNGVPEGLKKGN